MKIDVARMRRDFTAISKYGLLENGGVSRIALTPENLSARRYLCDALEEAGLQVTTDGAGNIRGRRAGTCDLSPVVIGSHLDTVPGGGHFDGVIGVLAALEVVRAMNDSEIATNRPIDIVNFTAEESSRFGVATLGSRAATGKLDLATAKSIADNDGISFYDALKNAGYDPDAIGSDTCKPGDIHAFLELHVEQGPILDSRAISAGVVTAIAAPSRFRMKFEGRCDHSGTTPMSMRRDALAGAAELVLGIERISTPACGGNTVGTVGDLRVDPGVMNVVPGSVELLVDIRDIDASSKQSTVTQVMALAQEIAARRGLEFDATLLCDESPISLSPELIETIERTASDMDIPTLRLHSGAGHDAMNMATVAPTGMIFVPSIGGISHNPDEKTDFDDILKGTELLAQVALKLARG